jgi:hypothetical protein
VLLPVRRLHHLFDAGPLGLAQQCEHALLLGDALDLWFVSLPQRLGGGDSLGQIIAYEAIDSADLRPLAMFLERQPSWSDFPMILLTRHGGGPERNPAAARFAEILGNVNFIERPFHPTTLASIVRRAVRSRRRQYEARARLEDLSEGEQRLQTAQKAGRLGFWALDVEGIVLNASKCCQLTLVARLKIASLLVVGAHAVLYHRTPHHDALRSWAKKLMQTKPFKLVAVALANKMARIAFAIMRGRTRYSAAPA